MPQRTAPNTRAALLIDVAASCFDLNWYCSSATSDWSQLNMRVLGWQNAIPCDSDESSGCQAAWCKARSFCV